MKPISVLIPTANQPGFLETALQSVAHQTAVDQIEEVLVSENLMNGESERVCKRFKSLPIRYIFQDPPVSQVEHFIYLYNQARADLVTLLCDDDWWGPGHFQGALQALKGNSEAVAWASACLTVRGDTPWTGVMSQSPILWILAGRPSVCETWPLTSHQVLAASWIITPFALSAMVIRRPAVRQAVSALADLHSYQVDRMLQVQLGTLGMILYEPVADTCIRSHSEALTWQFSKDARVGEFHKCTSLIWDLCEKQGVDVVSIWQRSLAGLNGQILEDVSRLFRMSMEDAQLRARGFEQLAPHPLVRMLRRARTIVNNRWKPYKAVAYKTFGLARRQERG